MTDDERLAREEIRDLMARYNIAGDRRDFAGLVATFAHDGAMHTSHGVQTGRENIAAYLGSGLPFRATLQFTRHNLSTSQLKFESATTVEGRTYFTVISDLGLDHAGVYVDRIVKVNGEWLFKKREIRLDYAHPESHIVITRRAPAK